MLIVFLHQADHPYTGFYTLIILEVLLASFLSLIYAPWMAGYTEMVEAKNPALVGTGLALWGWILRLTVGLSFIFLPLVINAVNPVVDNLVYAQTPPTGTAPFNVQQFQLEHPKSVAFAEANASWLKVLHEPKNAAVVAAAQQQPDGGEPGRLPEGGRTRGLRQDRRQPDGHAQRPVVPYETQLGLPLGAPERARTRFSTAWPSRPSSGSTGSGCASGAWCCSSRPSS